MGIHCNCGHHNHDIFGDHAFSCLKASKKLAHNIIATGFAKALAPTLTTAGLIQPNTMLDIEPNFYLMSDTTARPFDISFNPNPTGSHLCPFTTIGANITITGSPACPY